MFNSREEVIWASGLFEGEGWISIQGFTPAIGIQSSDLESLQRFKEAVNIGPIYYRKPRVYSYEKIHTRKPQWAWRVTGFEKVQAVLSYLWSGLSKRRKDRAKEVLQASLLPRPNRKRGRKPITTKCGDVRKYWKGCRCGQCQQASKMYSQKLRKAQKSMLPRINRKYIKRSAK